MTRASTCITTRASMVLHGASTCSNTCASTCITTRASTCHYTRARLLFKNMPPGPDGFGPFGPAKFDTLIIQYNAAIRKEGGSPERDGGEEEGEEEGLVVF